MHSSTITIAFKSHKNSRGNLSFRSWKFLTCNTVFHIFLKLKTSNHVLKVQLSRESKVSGLNSEKELKRKRIKIWKPRFLDNYLALLFMRECQQTLMKTTVHMNKLDIFWTGNFLKLFTDHEIILNKYSVKFLEK
jgi:hypothetical protein